VYVKKAMVSGLFKLCSKSFLHETGKGAAVIVAAPFPVNGNHQESIDYAC
jgi:hypothetical protein